MIEIPVWCSFIRTVLIFMTSDFKNMHHVVIQKKSRSSFFLFPSSFFFSLFLPKSQDFYHLHASLPLQALGWFHLIACNDRLWRYEGKGEGNKRKKLGKGKDVGVSQRKLFSLSCIFFSFFCSFIFSLVFSLSPVMKFQARKETCTKVRQV